MANSNGTYFLREPLDTFCGWIANMLSRNTVLTGTDCPSEKIGTKGEKEGSRFKVDHKLVTHLLHGFDLLDVALPILFRTQVQLFHRFV